jgi:hypothetical protein
VSSGSSYFGIADDGTLAWIPGGEPEKIREVGWMDRQGRWTPIPIPPGPYIALTLSPDGGRALIEAGPGGGAEDIWLADLKTGSLNRLTHDYRGGSCAWLPDGVRFVHARIDSGGGDAVVVRRLDGAGGEHELCRAPNPLTVTSVTPDGRYVLYSDYGQRQGRIHRVAIDGSSPPTDLPAEGTGYEQAAMVSPDGRWIAYISNKTRREEACLRRLGTTGGSWQVSTGGGGGVRWGKDGRELFFVSNEALMRMPLTTQGDDLTLGQTQQLFEAPPSPNETSFRDYAYDAANDRFLFTRPPRGEGERREIALSLGWAKRLPGVVNAGGARK